MQYTANYNLITVEGTDVVNPLVQMNPNLTDIDAAMFANKQATIGSASEIVSGTVHAITRSNPDSNYFRYTATGNWTSGDSMSVDGVTVTVYLSDGTVPGSGAYVINSEVFAMISGSRVTLIISSGTVTSSTVSYDNTGSGLSSTNVQDAIDELAQAVDHGIDELWANSDTSQAFSPNTVSVTTADTYDTFFIEFGNTSGLSMSLVGIEAGSNGAGQQMTINASGIILEISRQVNTSATATGYNIQISDCYTKELASYGSAPASTITNGRMIPYRIFGIKHQS